MITKAAFFHMKCYFIEWKFKLIVRVLTVIFNKQNLKSLTFSTTELFYVTMKISCEIVVL